MIYSNEKIRRQDRLLDEQSATKLLIDGEYGVLSMRTEDEGVYAVPVSYVWDGKSSIYFHCAIEGKKLRSIEFYNAVSFCIVGKTNVISNKFTTEYESIIIDCKATKNLPVDERMEALELLLSKYSPNDKPTGMDYARESFHRTEIVRLDIDKWSGKRKNI